MRNPSRSATWRDSDGKRRKVRGKTQADAERRRAEAIEQHETTRARDSRFPPATTVHELGAWWLADVAVVSLTSEQMQEWQSALMRGERALFPVGAERESTSTAQALATNRSNSATENRTDQPMCTGTTAPALISS